MRVQEMKMKVRLQEWSAQINDHIQSGLTVKQWCEKNGVNKTTYYNRMRRVREEMLNAVETGNTAMITGSTGVESRNITRNVENLNYIANPYPTQTEKPVFATLPVTQMKTAAAATVWINGYAVDVQNGADGAVIEQVLQVVARL